MPGTLLLIDGQLFCYRAFYAIRELTNSKGEPSNAIYGFITMIRKLMQDLSPESLAVCFDRKEPTFRHRRFADYKAHRKPMPDELVQQMPYIKKFVQASRIASFELAGYEADDLIGTIAKKAEKAGWKVIVATNDKDAMQLIDEKVLLYNPSKEELIDEKKVGERFEGLSPVQIIDMLGLMGDASDNIPGVPGIGEKTAVHLVKNFGSVEGVFENLDKIKGDSKKKVLRENEQIARLSKELAVIDCQAPIHFALGDLQVKDPDEKQLSELFKHFEFRSLLKELTPTDETGSEKRRYHTVGDMKQLKAFVQKLKKTKAFAIDTETTSVNPMRAHLVGISFSWKSCEAYYIPVSSRHHGGPGISAGDVLEQLAPILEDSTIEKWGQNIKYDMIIFAQNGVRLRGAAFDTMVASYLVNPIKLNHNLDDIAFEYLGVKKIPTAALLGKGRNQVTMDTVPLKQISSYACEDADCVCRLVEPLKKLFHVHRLERLFHDIEMPLVHVLAQMEQNGVALDLQFLKQLSNRAGDDLEQLTKQIYHEAGEEFNINSTKQLADILFTKLKLPVIKRTKTGFSTDVSVLEKLAENYDLPKLLLEYREKSKLKSTYLDAFPDLIHPETGFIHTSFNQTVTATGRLSSSAPNLQNIPIRTEAGREIRRAFVPRRKNRKIVSADYSQIELRILAHLSEDPNLTRAFQNDLDIHSFTATLLYGVKTEEVTREMRNAAKTINFSIVYGVSAFGLARELKISMPDAQAFIDSYFKRYARVKDFLEETKIRARENGFLTTMFGRRSYFPDIRSPNPNLRQFSERAAINAPVQGSAADLIKIAMIEIQKSLAENNRKSLMVIQVHDELVLDVPDDELSGLTEMVKCRMENAAKLRVPLKVDIVTGESWFKT